MTGVRVSRDDLLFAAEWLDAYDGQEDDDNNAAARRMAEWIMAEVRRRDEDAAVRDILKSTPGVTAAQARAALREVLAKGERDV